MTYGLLFQVIPRQCKNLEVAKENNENYAWLQKQGII
jgi:hypothetical protein